MNELEIKVCGITVAEDAVAAVELGASYVGVNFYAKSPRCIGVECAQEIARAIAGRAQLVGVFVNMNVVDVLRIARAVPLDVVQLHGDESREECEVIAREFEVIRAVRVDAAFTEAMVAEFAGCGGLLLDAPSAGYGGSGKTFDWAGVPWAKVHGAASRSKSFLAGGLDAGNVGAALRMAHPDVVDVCSGVESAKGVKSVEKMREFVAAVRAAERQDR